MDKCTEASINYFMLICPQEDTLWACLAAMATKAKNLLIAEEAYAAINEMDKVEYIQQIKVLLPPPLLLSHFSDIALKFMMISRLFQIKQSRWQK